MLSKKKSVVTAVAAVAVALVGALWWGNSKGIIVAHKGTDWGAAAKRCAAAIEAMRPEFKQAQKARDAEGLKRVQDKLVADLRGILSAMDPLPVTVENYPVEVVEVKPVESVTPLMLGGLNLKIPVVLSVKGAIPDGTTRLTCLLRDGHDVTLSSTPVYGNLFGYAGPVPQVGEKRLVELGVTWDFDKPSAQDVRRVVLSATTN